MDAVRPPVKPTALTHAETRLVIWGMLLPVFMSSLDQTILASALPTIGRDLGDVHSLPWLVTAYLIASTAVTPLYGKVSDIHGRRLTVLIALSVYMLGSLVCLAAPNMLVLICGRVLHGLGGGGMASMGMVVLGDLAAPRDRGKYYAYFSATYTTAGACGPALGGFIAQNLHWKVIFGLNMTMGVAALVADLHAAAPSAAARALPPARRAGRRADHGGERFVHARAQPRRRALSVVLAAHARARSPRADHGRRLRGAPARRAGAADPAVDVARSGARAAPS